MAKVSFSKLKCKVNEEIKAVIFADEAIEVKQYLPIQEKLALIGRVVELAHDADFNYSNPIKADVFRDLEMLFAYSNISFTEKQKEDIPKLYDMVLSSGLLTTVLEAIPEAERAIVEGGIWRSIHSIYTYQNSILGILDNISTKYENMQFDTEKITEALQNPENLAMVKSILDNFG